MTDCEAGEVTSSTDDVLPTSSADDIAGSPTPGSLTAGVDTISSSNPIAQAGGEDSTEDMDHMAFMTDQPVVMASTMEALSASGGQDDTGYAIITPDQALGAGGGHVILTTDGMVPADGQCVPLADTTTLQSLLNQGATSQLTTSSGETIQIITVGGPGDLTANKLWQVMPSIGSSEIGAIIIKPSEEANDAGEASVDQMDTSDTASSTTTQVVDMVPVSSLQGAVAEILMPPPPPPPPQNLPPGCPAWAARLKDCERIGDAFRGWVESEVELDLLLTYHKQQTQSFWGTRQSPSPAKQSTRLMWKSQYVPFDGMPFINSGSRAIVMECQYGPRRKTAQAKRMAPKTNGHAGFKQTCPARIYIKKVRKFPEFAVDTTLDKKTLKIAMDKSFQLLKDNGVEGCGQERFYVQLPTEASHEFHGEQNDAPETDVPRRLHPRVGQKIRDIVSSGESRLYAVRKALRRFVERELFETPENVPEKHNLTFYPTVNDLQNHIHQALQDINQGILPLTANAINMDVMPHNDDENSQEMNRTFYQSADGSPHAETVTVTLTQNPAEDGQHIISRVETHLSDGTTQVSTSLTPETAQLLAKLHPNMFPAGSLLQVPYSLQFQDGSFSKAPTTSSSSSSPASTTTAISSPSAAASTAATPTKVQTVTLLARPTRQQPTTQANTGTSSGGGGGGDGSGQATSLAGTGEHGSLPPGFTTLQLMHRMEKIDDEEEEEEEEEGEEEEEEDEDEDNAESSERGETMKGEAVGPHVVTSTAVGSAPEDAQEHPGGGEDGQDQQEEEEGEDGVLHGIQILDASSLANHPGVQIVQQPNGSLQFITANGPLTDANGQPLHIISGVMGGTGGISLVQHDGNVGGSAHVVPGDVIDDESAVGVSHGLAVGEDIDGQGVITIAMAPETSMIKTEEIESMVGEPLH